MFFCQPVSNNLLKTVINNRLMVILCHVLSCHRHIFLWWAGEKQQKPAAKEICSLGKINRLKGQGGSVPKWQLE